MSTAEPSESKASNEPKEPRSIKVVSHTTILYWWPVWLLGFIFGTLTLIHDQRIVVLPKGTKVKELDESSQSKKFEVITSEQPEVFFMAPRRIYGLIFSLVLLYVIFNSQVALRGLWSLIAIMGLVLLIVFLVWTGVWDPFVRALGNLHIYLSASGYFFFSSVLLILWILTVFVFDQRRYVIFTPGQFVLHREIGDAREVFDSTRVTVTKRRNDFFRHMVLGFGAGDVIVINASGAQEHRVELPNVLHADSKMREIADLMKTRVVEPE